MFRLYHLRSLRAWWATRVCDHEGTTRSTLVDMGRAKMFWCVRCQRTWFV